MALAVAGTPLATDSLSAEGQWAYLIARDADGRSGVWRSNGVSSGRVWAGEGASMARGLVATGGMVHFTTAAAGIPELWKSVDGNSSRVMEWPDGGELDRLTLMGGELFFVRISGEQVLWRSHGTEAGTVPVKVMAAAPAAYGERGLMAAGGRLFFNGNDGVSGFELWTSDGTTAGTVEVGGLDGSVDGWIGVEPRGAGSWGDELVFLGDDGIHGEEPWRSDGTAGGTAMVADVRPGAEGSEPGGLPRPAGDCISRRTTGCMDASCGGAGRDRRSW